MKGRRDELNGGKRGKDSRNLVRGVISAPQAYFSTFVLVVVVVGRVVA